MADEKIIKDEKKLTNEELTDEQLNEAAGGYVRPTICKPTELATCYLCQQIKKVDDMMYTVIKGERHLVCCKCMGVR